MHFADHDILTAGDAPDVLVAMNPAALKANLADLPKGAAIIVDTHDFTARNLTKAGYTTNPLDDDVAGASSRVHPRRPDRDDRRGGQGVRPLPQGRRPGQEHVRARPAVVDVRPADRDHDRLPRASGSPRSPTSATPTSTAFKAGWNFGETTETFVVQYEVKPAPMAPGTYRNITGNLALAYGLVAGSVQSGLPHRSSAPTRSPRPPTSSTSCSKHKAFGVTTFQAEDEIAGIGAAIGASFSGALGVTTTSGPGIALKSEAIGLAVMTELPLLVIDVQRGGPSTGLPTKTEQADLLQAMFGRNGEAPVPIVAPQSPGDCFDAAVEAIRIAVTYRTPVMLLSDGYLANGSEPWRIPDVADLPDDRPGLRDRAPTTGPTTAR